MNDDSLSEEDKILFRDHMRSVKPLEEKTKRTSKPTPALSEKPARKKNLPIVRAHQNTHLSDYVGEAVLSDTLLSYANAGLPSKRFRELRMGQIRWEARLDLHGLKADDARLALCQFIQNQANNNARCLLIIHGKGGHQGAPPVIKNLVNRWLPQLDEVIAFHSAQAKDGGHGAVYVLLKRNRS